MSEPRPASCTELEARFFRTLNGVLEPAVRAGWGSLLWPTGLIVLETTGRQSGRMFRVPVLATRIGGAIVASTTRADRSQWLKNLAAAPAISYWSAGQLHDADALVLSPSTNIPDLARFPAIVRPLVPGMALLAAAFGAGFAVLTPRA